MIAKFNKSTNNTLVFPISFSIILHLIVVGILLGNYFLSDRNIQMYGDNSIKAMMIDLSVMAAPEQSLVENQPEIRESDKQPIIEDLNVKIEPEQEKIVKEIETETEPDIIVKKEIIEKLEPAKDPKLIVKEETVKVKEKTKTKPNIQNVSKQKIRQEALTEKKSEVAVAPTISNNTQSSAISRPIRRNNPEYPRRALDLRIEGHVVVIFDIASNGKVENIRIVDAKPNNVFNKTVIQAMKQWKYQPIITKDVTVKIIFNRNKSVQFEQV